MLVEWGQFNRVASLDNSIVKNKIRDGSDQQEDHDDDSVVDADY